MNEQLIVKNFGPIKDATVDFKRVTVFIGPTGGGKSTLAKLLNMVQNGDVFSTSFSFAEQLVMSNLENYIRNGHYIEWGSSAGNFFHITNGQLVYTDPVAISFQQHLNERSAWLEQMAHHIADGRKVVEKEKGPFENDSLYTEFDFVKGELEAIEKRLFLKRLFVQKKDPFYVPSERSFVSALEYTWASLLKQNIGLPNLLLEFANTYSMARKRISELDIQFLNVKYIHRDGQDYIKLSDNETELRLYETASGIQSVTPLLVLLEHLSRNTEQAQSFIIEEPELNLYPTAQQGLLNWLVEKCTQGENDLTITTHSPYILSHLNLLLYAHQVAEKHPERAEDVANLVPRASWINPKEFACYQVENGGVESLVDAELGLIDTNELDALSGDAADAFDNLIRLSKGFAIK
jgi:predicted ATPase